MSNTEPRAWLLLSGGEVPPRWQDRATDMCVVPLLAGEAEQVLAGDTAHPGLEEDEERLARLLAQGHTTAVIADRLHVDVRTAQRRVARLRDRFGLDSKAELVSFLARRGF